MRTTRFRRHVLADRPASGRRRLFAHATDRSKNVDRPSFFGALCAIGVALLMTGAAPSPMLHRALTHERVARPLVYELPHYRTADFTRYGEIWRARTNRKVMALTFDDGPFPFYTPLLLHVLERSKVKATFFLVGRNVQEYPELIQDIVDSGDEIANHTFSHIPLPYLSSSAIYDQIADANALLEEYTHKPLTFFRPPHGRYDHRVVITAHELGLHTVFWSDSPDDTKDISVRTEIRRVLKQASPGGIVLLHSGQYKTIEALPTIIDALRQRGYTLEPVGSMLTDGETQP